MRRFLAAAFVACFLAATPYQAGAHGGGLDRYGCHNETATGGYHCHKSRKKKEDLQTALIVIGGIGAVVLLFLALKKPGQFAESEKGIRFMPARGDQVGAFFELRF